MYKNLRYSPLGHLRRVKYLLAILAVMDNQSFEQVACVLKLSVKTVHEWVRLFLCYGAKGAPRRKSPGRPSKLTKTQKAELARLIEAGPSTAGYSAGAWRTPLVQQLIVERFNVLYNVFYLAQLLKDLGTLVAESQVRLRPSG